MGEYDEVDVYGTFTAKEAAKLGIVRLGVSENVREGVEVNHSGNKSLATDVVAEKK